MPHGRVIPFTSPRRRVKATPEETLRTLTGRLTDNVQILVLDGQSSACVLKGLAQLIELAAIPARRRMAKADAEHAERTTTATRRH